MKNKNKVLGIIALIAIIGFSMAACAPEPEPVPDLPGTIAINPSTGVTTGTELTATYSGTETTVGYQWKKGDTNVGTNSNKFTPTEAGSYTVTVSAAGYKSKTSAAVTVTVPTGPQWKTVLNSSFGPTNISAIAYGNNVFVAGGYNGKMAYSADGVTWTAVTTQADNPFWRGEQDYIYSIAFGGGKFVAVGPGGDDSSDNSYTIAAYSTDGKTWTKGNFGSATDKSTSSFTLSYCKDMFVARGSSSQYVTSTDGLTWEDKGSGKIPIQTIAYGNDIFVAGADNMFYGSPLSKGTKIAISPDGGTWNGSDTTWVLKDVSGSFTGIPADDIAFRKIIFENGKFIALFGKTLTTSAGKITTSTDGVTWTTPVSSTMVNPLSIVYGNNKFVVSGYDMQGSNFKAKIATSTDGGATWTSTDVSSIFSGLPLIYIAYGSSKFVVVGQAGKIAYLEDN